MISLGYFGFLRDRSVIARSEQREYSLQFRSHPGNPGSFAFSGRFQKPYDDCVLATAEAMSGYGLS
jgi:hypothetical protein